MSNELVHLLAEALHYVAHKSHCSMFKADDPNARCTCGLVAFIAAVKRHSEGTP